MSKATKDELSSLHGELAKAFTRVLNGGEATAAHMNVIRQFLKDNGIDSAGNSAPLQDLTKTVANLPDFTQTDDEYGLPN